MKLSLKAIRYAILSCHSCWIIRSSFYVRFVLTFLKVDWTTACHWFHCQCWCILAADIEPDTSVAWRQVTAAVGSDAGRNSRATEGCVRTVASSQRQFGGHADTEVQHAVAVLLLVLTDKSCCCCCCSIWLPVQCYVSSSSSKLVSWSCRRSPAYNLYLLMFWRFGNSCCLPRNSFCFRSTDTRCTTNWLISTTNCSLQSRLAANRNLSEESSCHWWDVNKLVNTG